VSGTEDSAYFASTKANAKLVGTIARLVRNAGLDYHGFRRVCVQVQERLGLERPPKRLQTRCPLPWDGLERLYNTIEDTARLQQKIMLELLFYTEIRIADLVSIELEDVDLKRGRILIAPEDAEDQPCILCPEPFRALLQAHLRASGNVVWLFESGRRTGNYSPRRAQQLMKASIQAADLPPGVHPDWVRAEMRNWVSRQGLPETQLRLVSV